MDGKSCLFGDQLVESSEKGSATGQDDTAIHEIGGEFGRAALQGDPDGLDNAGDGLHESVADLLRCDGDGLGQSGDQVAPLHFHGELLLQWIGAAQTELDLLGCALADHQIIGALEILYDRLVQLIARHADAAAEDDAGQ